MGCSITAEKYNGLPSLYANAGDWVSGVLDFKVSYYFGSGDSNKITMGGTAMYRDMGNWGTDGFTVGDVITISFTKYVGPPPLSLSYTRTITYVNANVMYIDSQLPAPYTGVVFPTTSLYTGAVIQANKPPEAVDFYFNLVKNGTQSINSVIDGEVQRFQANNLTSLAVLGTANMVQVGNKSGGVIKDAVIQLLSVSGIVRNYRITYKFLQWGVIQDGALIPSYYSASDCLVPSIKVETFNIFNNPNGKQFAQNGALLANTGFFNENFNGGINNYSVLGLQWKDSLGNVIDSMDYSGTSVFEAVVQAPLQTGASKYRIGLFWDSLDAQEYQNLLPDLQNNLMILVPEFDFASTGVLNPTVYTSGTTLGGANFTITEIRFQIVGPNVNITGKITPNAQFNNLMSSIPDGGRKFKIFAQISNSLLVNEDSNKVNLILFDSDCYDAPTIGVQIPNIHTELLLDHSGQDITDSITANTTTEDDILYTCDFLLPENTNYDGIRCGMSARNNVTGESFVLENQFLSFNSVPFIAGKYVPNISIQRGFLLPLATDRNVISLQRKPILDVVGLYGLTLNYGFLLDWRYWIELPAVNDYFFDVLQDFNGKNRDWKMFFNGDWNLYIDLYTEKNGVEDYNHFLFKPRDYEDEPTVSSNIIITSPDGSNPSTFLNNEVSTVDLQFNWNQIFDEEWVQVTAETKEGARIGFISSVLNSIMPNNILKPLIGQNKLILYGTGTNQLDTAFKIDTNGIPANEISLTYRVFSVPKLTMGYIIQGLKDASIAHSVLKVSPDTVYAGPCMKVRRVLDNALLDVGFVGGVLDTASILTFVGSGSATVHTWYDQSGTNFHSKQATNSKQPFIVQSGIVVTDPFNGLPALTFDGVDDYFDLNSVIQIAPTMLTTWVMNKESGFGSIAFGNLTDNGTTALWLGGGDNRIFTYLGASLIDHGIESTFNNALISTTHNFTTSTTNIYVNGVLFGTEVEVANTNLYQYIGRIGTYYSQGLMQELVYWNKDKEAQRPIIEANTIMRYGL